MTIAFLRPLALAATAAFGLSLAAAPVLAQNSNQPSRAAQEERAREDARRGTTSGRPAPNEAARRERGQREAPALVQAAGLNCQVSEAIWRGTAGSGASARQGYEVACGPSLGYILVTGAAGAAPTAVDCLAAETVARRDLAANPQANVTRCSLPGNANPAQQLQPLVQQANLQCTVNNARAVGEAGGFMRYEVGCAQGGGYLIDRPAAGSAEQLRTTSCFEASASNIACEFTPRAALLTQVGQLVGGQTPACTPVEDYRIMGRSQSGSTFIEVKCGANGYVAELNAQNQVQQWLTCTRASAIGGGCTLTSAAVAAAAEAPLYTASARQIGLDCNVERYRRVGREQNNGREVVELVCAGRPEGVLAFFPVPGGTGQGEYVDCVVAAARQAACQLTPINATFPRLTQEIAGKGQTCSVSEARGVGQAPDGQYYVEVACSGRPGYFLAYRGRALNQAIPCRDAAGIGSGCTLPANTAARSAARAEGAAASGRR